MNQSDREVLHRKPDTVVKYKEERTCIIIYPACPEDDRVFDKEEEKHILWLKIKKKNMHHRRSCMLLRR